MSKTKRETLPTGKIRHKSTQAEIVKLQKPGDSFQGRLVDMKIRPLKGRQLEPTPTRMYVFELPNGDRKIITGKSMLDDQFDELVQKETSNRSGGVEDEGGMAALVGFVFSIERGADTETTGGNTLGTYVLTMYDND